MTHTTNDAPVTVEQCDREAAAEWYAQTGNEDAAYRCLHPVTPTGGGLVQAFARYRHRLAALASAPAGDGVEEASRRARFENERWHDESLMSLARTLDEDGHGEASEAVLKTAAALARPRAAVGEQSREAIEAECAALIATYYRREIGTLMQQAEHWAENGKPLAVHHRVMKADDYFQIVCQMERDPAKGWKLPFDEIRDALGRKPSKDPGTYPPSKDLYRYRDPAFVVAALQFPPAK